MFKISLIFFALSGFTTFADLGPPLPPDLGQALPADFGPPRLIYEPGFIQAPPLHRMRVYRKDGPKQPPLDSFRLEQGKPEIWRWENEAALFKVGKKVSHKISELDSIVLEEHGMAFPAPTGEHLLFLQEAGPINLYAYEWDAKDLPDWLKKGNGPVTPATTQAIRDMVADDPEATRLIERYSNRWKHRLGISASGAGLVATGLALAWATEVKHANGEKKPSTPIPGIIVLTGLVAVVVPVTPWVNFIWKPLPKRALDSYNRNRKVGASAVTAP